MIKFISPITACLRYKCLCPQRSFNHRTCTAFLSAAREQTNDKRQTTNERPIIQTGAKLAKRENINESESTSGIFSLCPSLPRRPRPRACPSPPRQLLGHRDRGREGRLRGLSSPPAFPDEEDCEEDGGGEEDRAEDGPEDFGGDVPAGLAVLRGR